MSRFGLLLVTLVAVLAFCFLAEAADCPTGPAGIRTCRNRADGDYQMCTKCNKYVSCVAGRLVPNRPCPAKLVWDDSIRRCEWKSTTCTEPKPKPECPTGTAGIKSCRGRKNGDYQDCYKCKFYVTCSNGGYYPNRPCPAGLVWDDKKKLCDYKSDTCEV